MDLVRSGVCYCCVSKGGRVLYTYSSGDHEIENMAAFCLELIPPYHRWYVQTMAKKTFGFLMDNEYIYFAIMSDSLGNLQILTFLRKLKDEFRKLGERGSSTRSLSTLDLLCLQEQLLPVVLHLIESLDHASAVAGANWPADIEERSPSPGSNNASENGASTKAPLLGKHGKQEKKNIKNTVINIRDHEMEEHMRSTDGVNNNNQETSASPLQKDSNMRVRSNSQSLQKKWCRQVKIVLAIDVVVCIFLFGIWLIVCRGVDCTR